MVSDLSMTIPLNPEAVSLKRHAREVSEKIDRAIAQANRGELMTPDQSALGSKSKKAACVGNSANPTTDP